MIWTTPEIGEALRQYAGERLLGVVTCEGALEVVFAESSARPNLLSLCDDGQILHGSVADPEQYVCDAEAWRQSEAA